MEINPERVSTIIENFIRQNVIDFQRDGVVLGMSGGIDSAVVGTLAYRALGPDKVLALLLPERDSSPSSKADALKVIERLGISYREIPLTPVLNEIGIYQMLPLQMLGLRSIKEAVTRDQHRRMRDELHEMPFRAGLLGTKDLGKKQETLDAGNAYARIKHRTRMLMLYYVSDLENRLVLGTTNKSESMTGFVVKWGDNVADIEPIVPLYKTQVRQLAQYLKIPQIIIDKAPSPDLIPGVVDEYALGIDYTTLDRILWSLENGWNPDRIINEWGVTPEQVSHVSEMTRRSKHLRCLPPAPDLDL